MVRRVVRHPARSNKQTNKPPEGKQAEEARTGGRGRKDARTRGRKHAEAQDPGAPRTIRRQWRPRHAHDAVCTHPAEPPHQRPGRAHERQQHHQPKGRKHPAQAQPQA